MKSKVNVLCIAASTFSAASNHGIESEPNRTFRTVGTTFELAWQGTFQSPDGSRAHPYFELQRSSALRTWSRLGERRRAINPYEL
jgi:hypothetical protein